MQIKFKEYPHMKPLRMPTKDKGFFGGIWLWIATTRKWEITEDWTYSLGDTQHFVIPKGFVFDGASVPKYFRSYLSPMGVLLIGGLVHDYGYKHQTLLMAGKKKALSNKSQKWMDQTFRDINIDQNGFKIINWIAYLALRGGGWLAWRKHRKNNIHWKDSV